MGLRLDHGFKPSLVERYAEYAGNATHAVSRVVKKPKALKGQLGQGLSRNEPEKEGE